MLTVSTMSGSWKVDNQLAVGGSAFGLIDWNWTWIVALPKSGSSDTTFYQGSIWQSKLNHYGDRDCVHYEVDGSIVLYGDKISRGFVDPVSTTYVGPPIRLESFYFPCGKWDSFSAAGILTLGPQPWKRTFPDHSLTNGNSFRNAWMEGQVDGNRARIVFHYEDKLPSGAWRPYDGQTSWREYDPTNCKVRWVGESTWSSPLSLQNSGLVPRFDHNRLTTGDWGRIFARLDRMFPDTRSSEILGDLCRRCANDAQLLDLNSIEYLSDIRNVVTDLKEVLSLLKGKATLKSAAKLYLGYKYGVRLTIEDTISIFQAIPRHLAKTSRHYRWARAAEGATSLPYVDTPVRRTDLYHYKVYYDPYDTGLMNIIDKAWSVGLFPSLQNSWDLIPMSFVVDWFTQLSDRLSAYDASTFWSCNRVLGSLGSIKTVYSGVSGDIIFPSLPNSAGVVTVSKYSRFGADTVVNPTFFSDTPREFKNYAEATALFISRSKRLKK